MFVSVYADGGADGALLIYPDGKILAFLGGTARFTSLAGVSFPAVIPARHGLTLLNGWESAHSAYGTANPGYRVIHGVVYLSGGLRQPHGSDGQFAVLPAGARPASALAFPVYSAGFVGTLEIQPDGTMTASSSPLQNARTFTSLAGISYPLGT